MQLFSGIIKYVLFVFNLLIVICGIALIAVGAIIIANENKGLDSFTDFSVGGFAIGVGLIIFFVASFGCWGAIKENSCLLTTYAAILIVLLILQIVLGALAFVALQNDDGSLDATVRNLVQEVFDEYVGNQDDILDKIQQDFECCGVSGTTYWLEEQGRDKLPSSCCENNDCTNDDNIYQKGCATAFQDFISAHIVVIAWIAVVVGAVELFGAIFAFVVRNRFPLYNY